MHGCHISPPTVSVCMSTGRDFYPIATKFDTQLSSKVSLSHKGVLWLKSENAIYTLSQKSNSQ